MSSTCHYQHAISSPHPFNQLAVSSAYHFINSPFNQLALSSTYHFINLPFHQLTLSSTCHFTKMLYHQLAISSTGHFPQQPINHDAIASTCHYTNGQLINMAFLQLTIQPTYSFLYHFIKSHFLGGGGKESLS
jgi:hypothetical protein